jgi:hypothetical protein
MPTDLNQTRPEHRALAGSCWPPPRAGGSHGCLRQETSLEVIDKDRRQRDLAFGIHELNLPDQLCPGW